MPLYGTLAIPSALYPGDQFKVWNADSPAAGQASERIALGFSPHSDNPGKLSVRIKFSGAPGTFKIDFQNADDDVTSAYQNITNPGSVTAVDANNEARVDFVPFSGRFARLVLTTAIQNAVTLTATLTR